MPVGYWQELTYHVGPLARDYNGTWAGMATPYTDGSQIQDGWALANMGSSYVMAPACVASDGGNQFFMQQGEGAARASCATHPIGNDFTNGVIRISVDMRAPAAWPADGATARVAPLYKSQMNALNWGAYYQTPVAFGMIWRANKSETVPFLLSARSEGGSAKGNDLNVSMGQDWHRFVVDIDLDAKRAACSVYSLGADHPAPETAGTLAASISDLYFFSPLTAARGAVSGIGIYTDTTSAAADDAANSACFDNLSVAWKAPGTSDFLPCYENDFTTRRVRTVCPAGTTSAAYTATATLENDDFTGYVANTKLIPDSDRSLKNVAPQPTGVDNWRRINDDGLGDAIVADSKEQYYGAVLVMQSSQTFVCASQPLGEEITSGKVRMTADLCRPGQWHWRYRTAAIEMGTTSFASTLYGDFSLNRIGEVGVGATSTDSETAAYPLYLDDTGTHYMTTTNCPGRTWWRVVRTADIDSQTYDFEIYALVNGATNEPPVVSVTGVKFKQEVRSIGSFALLAYGSGNEGSKAILFDNIKVWKDADTAQETLIYSNDFSTRRRRVDVARADIAPVIDRADSGVDGWTRRNNGLAAAFVQSAENPALAIAGATDHAYVFHPFGTTVRSGTVRFRVDLRPATKWRHWNLTCGGKVMLGDDTFLQGNRNASDVFGSHCSVDFGLDGAAGAADACGLVQGSKPYAMAGATKQSDAALDTTHWYRFCVKAPLAGGTYSVDVYDMGSEHPVPETPDGALVRRFSDLAYCNGGPALGISGFALAGYFVPGYSAWDPEDPDALLFDNIRVETVPSGAMIILR